MNKLVKSLLVCGIATGFVSSASALTISITPASQTIGQGGPASFDIVVSDLGGLKLGGFDAQVNFDSSVAIATDVVFGTAFAGNNDFEDLSIAGQAYMADTADAGSFLSGAGSYLLATLVLEGVADGTTSLVFDTDFTSFTNENGVTILSFTANGAELTVAPDLGSSSTLLGLGVLCLGLVRSRFVKA